MRLEAGKRSIGIQAHGGVRRPQGHLGLPDSYVVGHSGFRTAPNLTESCSVLLEQGSLVWDSLQRSMLALRVHTGAHMHREPTRTAQRRDYLSCAGEKMLCSSAPALALLWGSLNNTRFPSSIQLCLSMLTLSFCSARCVSSQANLFPSDLLPVAETEEEERTFATSSQFCVCSWETLLLLLLQHLRAPFQESQPSLVWRSLLAANHKRPLWISPPSCQFSPGPACVSSTVPFFSSLVLQK